jgi:hypothetical protein
VSKVEEIVFRLIDKMIVNCDSYSHQDSFWLILTEEKKWIIEFTDSKILWFNYQFFNDIFTWVGLEDKKTEYIQKWFESRFLDNPKVNDIDWLFEDGNPEFKHVIEDGVMSTGGISIDLNSCVEDTIQNGVLLSRPKFIPDSFAINDTIQNGVLLTKEGGIDINNNMSLFVNEVIKNGVKQTIPMGGNNDIESVMDFMLDNDRTHICVNLLIEDVIQNGKKID